MLTPWRIPMAPRAAITQILLLLARTAGMAARIMAVATALAAAADVAAAEIELACLPQAPIPCGACSCPIFGAEYAWRRADSGFFSKNPARLSHSAQFHIEYNMHKVRSGK